MSSISVYPFHPGASVLSSSTGVSNLERGQYEGTDLKFRDRSPSG